MKAYRKGAQKRHILKSITWRAIASIATFLLAWLFTDDIAVASAIGGTEVVVKMILYYLHERAWYKYIDFDRKGVK